MMEFKAGDEVLSDAQSGEAIGAEVKGQKAVTMDKADKGSDALIAEKRR